MAFWKIINGVMANKNVKPIELKTAEGLERVMDGVYYPGDIIETDLDLNKHNSPGSTRVKRLYNYVRKQKTSPLEDLSRMTIQELRRYAAEQEIELDSTLMKKAEILNAIESSIAEVGV